MEETTLAEAYRRRESIDMENKAIYCKGGSTGTTHRIVFHARQPEGNWYNVWLVANDDAVLVAMHVDARVYIGEGDGTHRTVIVKEGRSLAV
jgi:hypothetical protein